MLVCIVTPVYNDWESFSILVKNIDKEAANWGVDVCVVAVDDGSEQHPDLISLVGNVNIIRYIDVVTLSCNVGHQRAIAAGLVLLHREESVDCFIIMDSDGEDRPAEIGRLVKAHYANPNAVIAAQRTKRSEGFAFRLFYIIYKFVFMLTIGKKIDFGNFCLIPRCLAVRLVHMPDLWNHLAGTIVRSRFRLVRIGTERGTRYAGKSNMNLVSLVMHGLSAISVFSDVVSTRLFLLSVLIMGVATITASLAVMVRLLTDIAIPGWATYVVGISAVVVFQGLAISAGAVFLTLSRRSALTIIPAKHALNYIASRQRVVSS